MALQPFFSLTPLSPYVNTYDPYKLGPYAIGQLNSFGASTRFFPPWSLADQYNNNEIILAYDPVEPADQNIGSVLGDVYERCAIQIAFRAYEVTTEDQYLLLFALNGRHEDPSAQFFVGGDWVRTEQLSGDEQVAILLDSPGSGFFINIFVRLAAENYWAKMGFRGMDCYLL